MNKTFSLFISIFILLSALCACDNSSAQSKQSTPQYLSREEARIALIDFAEPELATAVEIPTWAFEMTNYRIIEATHYESLGYWYFEVSGKIPMYDDGLWYIYYEFDARVDHLSGKVTLGELSLRYG